MHIENLGEKTYLMSIDPTQLETDDDGNASITFMNGATETRLNLGKTHTAEMQKDAFTAVVSGQARLCIAINDECNLIGFEEMDVESIERSDITQRVKPFVEEIPF